jgi:hypothetical protein
MTSGIPRFFNHSLHQSEALMVITVDMDTFDVGVKHPQQAASYLNGKLQTASFPALYCCPSCSAFFADFAFAKLKFGVFYFTKFSPVSWHVEDCMNQTDRV